MPVERKTGMDYLFLLSVMFLLFCFIFRKRLAEKFTLRPRKKQQELPEPVKAEAVVYKILAFNAKDFGSTKELENMMELRLEQCLSGLSRQGRRADVEFHSTGFVLVYLVRYTC